MLGALILGPSDEIETIRKMKDNREAMALIELYNQTRIVFKIKWTDGNALMTDHEIFGISKINSLFSNL
jgi:hypothetical protein